MERNRGIAMAYQNNYEKGTTTIPSNLGGSIGTPTTTSAGTLGTSTTGTLDWAAYYDQQYQAQLDALNAAYQAQVQQLQAQLPQIKQAYDTQRGQTYTNSRLSALGNNEAAASMGLAGNAYAGPQSGYSETSRISQTNALRNALNAANLQQTNTEQGVSDTITQAGFSRDQSAAEALASVNSQRASALQNQSQFDAQMAAEQAAQEEATRQYNEQMASQQAAQAEAIRQYNEQMAAQQAEAAYNQALTELSTFGMIKTQEAADALGVPIGTTLKSLQGKTSSSGSSTTRSVSGTSTEATDDEIAQAFVTQFGTPFINSILGTNFNL